MLTTLPPGFAEVQVAAALTRPTAMEFAPDGRLFVAEQGGSLRVIEDGGLLPTPFVSLPVDSTGERGLLGVAFDPNFATNHFVYVYYTSTAGGPHNRVSRFTAAGDVAAPGPEVVLLDLDPLGATNHNGGAIHFGKDGKLYIGVGDNAVATRAQSLDNPFGKLLRINADGSIPADNPFLTSTTGKDRAIWAIGLRNPFTFAVDPATGQLFINDVGSTDTADRPAAEEINIGKAGANYGWPIAEGYSGGGAGFERPLSTYGHGAGNLSGCAISGGTFYDPPAGAFPADLIGGYFFADFCNGWIRVLPPNSISYTMEFATGIDGNLVDLKVGPDGALYYLKYDASSPGNEGSVVRIQATASPAAPDLGLYRPSTADWITHGPEGYRRRAFGAPNLDVPVPGDYDRDGQADLAVYRPTTGEWIVRGSTGVSGTLAFGLPNVDVPVQADYDGDGRTDLAVYRPTTGEWFVLGSAGGQGRLAFGAPNSDQPVPADFDGDGHVDIAVYRPTTGEWFVLGSRNGAGRLAFGLGNLDRPVPADFDGDGKVDIAVYRPNTEEWFVLGSKDGFGRLAFGDAMFDQPVPADYDRDGKADIAVYSTNDNEYALLQSSQGFLRTKFGRDHTLVPLDPPEPDRYLGPLRPSTGAVGLITAAARSTAALKWELPSIAPEEIPSTPLLTEVRRSTPTRKPLGSTP